LVFLASAAFLLVSAPPAQAQIVADPYTKSGPADQEREFIASHTGQPKAPETAATLKKLYTEAAKYYATDATGHLFLRYTATGGDGGSGATGVPLTWTDFGKGIKAGQIVLIRLTETPAANTNQTDKTATPPPPQVIEYTVRWLPELATPAPTDTAAAQTASANTTADAPASTSSSVPAKKLASDLVAYLATFRAQEITFLVSHGSFRALFGSLDAAAKKVKSAKGDPAPEDVSTLLDLLNQSIKFVIDIGGRDLQTTAPRIARGQIRETQASRDTALKMDRQLEDMKNASFPPPPPKDDF